jgi:hypothetical protein
MDVQLKAFAIAVRGFQAWALAPQGGETERAADALDRLVGIYGAALRLLPLPDPTAAADDETTVGEAEWKSVYELAGGLPVNYYSEVFNPLAVPPEEPAVADLADDIADIYRDLVEGLRLFDKGEPVGARWQWVFSLPHWGEHATSAIRVLHCFLAERDAFLP